MGRREVGRGECGKREVGRGECGEKGGGEGGVWEKRGGEREVWGEGRRGGEYINLVPRSNFSNRPGNNAKGYRKRAHPCILVLTQR